MKTGPAFFSSVAAAGPVTWNPSDKSADISLSGSNLVATRVANGAAYRSVRANVSKAYTGQGYFEIVITTMGAGAPYIMLGIATGSAALSNHVGVDVYGWSYYGQDGKKFTNAAGSAYGSAFAQGAVIGVAFNNGKVWFAENNTWNGDPAAGTGEAFSGITGTIFPMVSLYDGVGGEVDVVTGKFKSSDFTYSPPSGFSAWE